MNDEIKRKIEEKPLDQLAMEMCSIYYRFKMQEKEMLLDSANETRKDFDIYFNEIRRRMSYAPNVYPTHLDTEMVEGEKKEAYKQGALWAYKMFLETIKDAKDKFPDSSKEFEITVDVRDIEKSIEYLSQTNKQEETK